jgi:hypothetical protein
MRLEEAASLEHRQVDFARKAITWNAQRRAARTVPTSAQASEVAIEIERVVG